MYGLLRYGVKVKPDIGEQNITVWLIDWEHQNRNTFAIAEEVTIAGENTKRPDIVLYVNGIALGVLELKRSHLTTSSDQSAYHLRSQPASPHIHNGVQYMRPGMCKNGPGQRHPLAFPGEISQYSDCSTRFATPLWHSFMKNSAALQYVVRSCEYSDSRMLPHLASPGAARSQTSPRERHDVGVRSQPGLFRCCKNGGQAMRNRFS